jgi:hypothetical protein
LYVGGITITGQADVTLLPGIYYMQCGGFNFGGQTGGQFGVQFGWKIGFSGEYGS